MLYFPFNNDKSYTETTTESYEGGINFSRLDNPRLILKFTEPINNIKIYNVGSKIFEKISQHKNFRLFANVKIDLDSQIEELIKNYDAVILAIGASRGKKLNIQGENLSNVFSSAEFVPWYNAHPDFESLKVNFSSKDRKSTRLNSSHTDISRMPSSA